MPAAQSEILNRTIVSSGIAGDALPDINAVYRRKVDIQEGVSLTGFIATGEILTSDTDPRNRLDVFLWEDPIINLVGGFIVEPNPTFLVNRYILGFSTETFLLSEKFDRPIQLRYGHTYFLLARFRLFAGVITVPGIQINLTPLGFENTGQTGSYFGDAR